MAEFRSNSMMMPFGTPSTEDIGKITVFCSALVMGAYSGYKLSEIIINEIDEDVNAPYKIGSGLVSGMFMSDAFGAAAIFPFTLGHLIDGNDNGRNVIPVVAMNVGLAITTPVVTGLVGSAF